MPKEDFICVQSAAVADDLEVYEGVCAGGEHEGMLCVANRGSMEISINPGQVLAVAGPLGSVAPDIKTVSAVNAARMQFWQQSCWGELPKEPPSCDYWREEPGVWVRVHCEPRTALYVPSEEDLAVEGKKSPRGLSVSPGARSSDAAGGQAPALGELGPTRCTSLIYQDGTVDYVEDEEVWANGEELSLSN